MSAARRVTRRARVAVLLSSGLLWTLAACSGPSSKTALAQDASKRSEALAAPDSAASESPEAARARAEVIVRRGILLSQTVRRKLEDARREADIIKTTCLDDKRTEIDVNLRTAEARFDALKGSVDPERRAHESAVLNVLDRRLQLLAQDAEQCLGQALYETGNTRLIAEVDRTSLPLETPSRPPAIAPAADIPPPPVSTGR